MEEYEGTIDMKYVQSRKGLRNWRILFLGLFMRFRRRRRTISWGRVNENYTARGKGWRVGGGTEWGKTDFE